MPMPSTERSRAYPILPLEDGRRLIGEILTGLGDGAFSREVLGEALGYSNARGGPGARKIAALAQFGFLRRKAGLYSPTALAREAVKASSDLAQRAALCQALHKPPLFGALLDRYLPQGRVPSQLAGVLWREYGITRKASQVAAETFYKSARFAGVLDREGAFLPDAPNPPISQPTDAREAVQTLLDEPAGPASERAGDSPSEQRFEFVLTRGRVAKLFLPLRLCRRDLGIIRRQIDFLEYQVTEEEAHE